VGTPWTHDDVTFSCAKKSAVSKQKRWVAQELQSPVTKIQTSVQDFQLSFVMILQDKFQFRRVFPSESKKSVSKNSV
jgi:hypothetical protein